MKPSTEEDYRERIIRTLVFIQEHLDDPLELDDIASVAAFSRFHFHRIFRGLVGESVKEYVRRLRLERAARNLNLLDDPVTQIALEAGFETHESFTRAFGEMFGVAPSAYRAAHKPAPESVSGTHWGDVAGYHSPDYPDLPPVEIRKMPGMRVVFLRHAGPYNQVGTAWMRLMTWAGMRGLLGPAMVLIGIVHDDPDVTPSEKIRYDACVVVDRPVEPEGEFGVMEIAASNYVVVEHRGPYEAMGRTYQRIYGGWI